MGRAEPQALCHSERSEVEPVCGRPSPQAKSRAQARELYSPRDCGFLRCAQDFGIRLTPAKRLNFALRAQNDTGFGFLKR